MGLPQVIVERPLRPEKVTEWSALWSGGVIDSYFLKREGYNGKF